MNSRFIATFASESSGILKGTPQVKACWQTALERIPELLFGLLEVFTFGDSITIYYKAVLGKLATEVIFLNQDGKAYNALAHYNR